MNGVSISSMVLIGIGLVNLVIAGYVFLRNPKNLINRIFFLLVAGASLWVSGIGALALTKLFFFDKLVFYAGTCMFLGLVLFAKTFPYRKTLSKKFLLLLIPFLVIFALIPFNVFVKGLRATNDGSLSPINGPAFPFFVLVMGGYIFYSMYLLLRTYHHASDTERLRMKYFFLGLFTFLGMIFLFDILLPFFNIFRFNLLGPLSSIVFISFTGYAIVKHQLLDIRLVIQRGLLYVITLSVVSALYFLFIFGIGHLLGRSMFINPVASAFAAAVVVVCGFPYFRRFFEKLTDPLFFKKEYNVYQGLRDLGQVLSSTIDLDMLLDSVAHIFKRDLKIEIFLFILANSQGIFRVVRKNGAAVLEHEVDPQFQSTLIFVLEASKKIIFLQTEIDNPDHELRETARRLGLVLAISLFSKGKLVAVMMLGEKKSQSPFTQKDVEFLTIFSHQAGVAFENARLYEEIKQYSAELEEKVEERTDKVKQLYESQLQFLADVSHELQTPLAILQGNFDLLRKNVGSKNRRKIPQTINKTLERMSRLVNDLLLLARADGVPFRADTEMVRLDLLLQELYEDCEILAENKNIDFVFKKSGTPCVSSDREHLKELFLNLISNALKFTPVNGAILIELTEEGNDAVVRVADSGEGIPPHDLSHVFERFYQSKHVTGKKGTGLGLSISKQIVESGGGTISARNKEGEGAEFIVRLPLYGESEIAQSK